jgi:hypothetical protein
VRKSTYNILVGILKIRNHLGDTEAYRRIVIKQILNNGE